MYKIEDLPSADELAASMEKVCPSPQVSYEYTHQPAILPIVLSLGILVLSAVWIRKNRVLINVQGTRLYSFSKNHGLVLLLMVLLISLWFSLSTDASKRVRTFKRDVSRVSQRFYTTTQTETDASREARRVWNRCWLEASTSGK
ncbi:hypothetical protein KBA73_04115 [Patescibacteria group bacterium]|nr:hypothetical protein [Patescibacteria group bacterium]